MILVLGVLMKPIWRVKYQVEPFEYCTYTSKEMWQYNQYFMDRAQLHTKHETSLITSVRASDGGKIAVLELRPLDI